MRGNEFLDKMGLIAPDYIEMAEAEPKKKKNGLVIWGTMVACLCLVIGAISMASHFYGNYAESQPGEIVLSNKTTAKVSYGYDDREVDISKELLVYLTEEEMFHHENMYIFRGKVVDLTNVTIDFNGTKKVRCIANILIDEVYQGELIAGDQVTMLIPCAIDLVGYGCEDTDVIIHLKDGMEGIFMPWVYEEDSYMEMNGAVLMLQDLAACGLADGMRWAFLDTDGGLVFLRDAYPGAKDAANLDDIEEYVIEMLRGVGL